MTSAGKLSRRFHFRRCWHLAWKLLPGYFETIAEEFWLCEKGGRIVIPFRIRISIPIIIIICISISIIISFPFGFALVSFWFPFGFCLLSVWFYLDAGKPPV